MTIDHQEKVGKKREKRKYEAAQEKAAGTYIRRILLVKKITIGAKRTGEEREPSGATLFTGAGCAGRPSRRLGKCPPALGQGELLLRRRGSRRAALAGLVGSWCNKFHGWATAGARALLLGR